jgi:hypothetical protein
MDGKRNPEFTSNQKPFASSVSECVNKFESVMLIPPSGGSIMSFPGGEEPEVNAKYNQYGLPTEVDGYGNGNGAVGPLLRTTVTSYATLGNNVEGRPSSVTVNLH